MAKQSTITVSIDGLEAILDVERSCRVPGYLLQLCAGMGHDDGLSLELHKFRWVHSILLGCSDHSLKAGQVTTVLPPRATRSHLLSWLRLVCLRSQSCQVLCTYHILRWCLV